ncbi:unnamed protein product [Bursaphelenchus okinawaensis]|uniref:2-amino-3-carboxymuconate-6-semialdehyde decarboxylase n=1 Tax=Bursaphelenchus okinawaensis TaxID=465554 RepID=A0A811KDI3_9BILA|nr:unnamed protein product [Bursaphelenchus okinawaensis]CAG9102666.1 unnamed protein product [Bursaphelenchus okinawaensis]
MDEWHGRMKKYWLPWLVGMPSETAQAICCVVMGGILERFPRLKICFAHGGGSYPQIAGRVSHGFKVRPDICASDTKVNPSEFNGKFYTDSLVHDTHALSLLSSVVGWDKICLGTDYPFPLGELEPGKIVKELDDDKKTKILWSNPIEMLNLKEDTLHTKQF